MIPASPHARAEGAATAGAWADRAPRVGLLGTPDSADPCSQLLRSIIERELRRRLPAVSFASQPSPNLDVLVLAGDESSRGPLAGLDPNRAIALVPDPRLLASDLFSSELLACRRRQLAAVGSYPETGLPLVLELGPSMSAGAALQAILAGVSPNGPLDVVLLERGTAAEHGAERASVVPAAWPGRVFHLQAGMIEDVVAAIAHARAFVGATVDLVLCAFSFGLRPLMVGADCRAEDVLAEAGGLLPMAPVDLAAELQPRLDGQPAHVETARRSTRERAAASFDRLAELADAAAARRLAARGVSAAALDRVEILALRRRNEELERAHRILREQQRVERAIFAEQVNRLAAGEDVAHLVSENAFLRRAWAEARSAAALAEQRTSAGPAAQATLPTDIESRRGGA